MTIEKENREEAIKCAKEIFPTMSEEDALHSRVVWKEVCEYCVNGVVEISCPHYHGTIEQALRCCCGGTGLSEDRCIGCNGEGWVWKDECIFYLEQED